MAINQIGVYNALLILFHIFLAKSSLYQCKPCGVWSQKQNEAVGSGGPWKQRIVGGYKAKSTRPWMAYVEIKTATANFHCGGAIINRMFILSAAHCACDSLPCKVNSDQQLFIDYEPKGKIKVFVGFQEISKKEEIPGNVYDVIGVKVHEKYRQDFHDLALLKVDGEIRFSLTVSPICLPPDSQYPDLGEKAAFVAGWGHLSNEVCHTNAYGPSPFMPCLFPFKWNDKVYSACAKDAATPSDANAICQKLAHISNISAVGPSLHVNVRSSLTAKSLATCFNSEASESGWCATCKLDVPETDPYSCSAVQASKSDWMAQPQTDEGWGFCQEDCSPQKKRKSAESLHEVELSLFDTLTCAQVLKKSNTSYNFDKEICAGRLNRRFISNIFVSPTAGGMTVDSTRTMKPTMKAFIGGQDSCLGDSGGPLWKVIGSTPPTAILVGIVSRGLNCANADAPGIYVRVKMYLNWIRKNAREGNCPPSQANKWNLSFSDEMLSFSDFL